MHLQLLLEEIRVHADADPVFRSHLIEAARGTHPMVDFCRICRNAGIEIYPMDLADADESEYAAMRRSTNGGGENSPHLSWEGHIFESFERELEQQPFVRRAEKKDIPGILRLLVQVDMVHHNGRPDLFQGPATKYDAVQLEAILADAHTPVFVCVNENDDVLGHAFCIHKQILGDPVLTDIKTLYIDDICVDEAARGMGIGTALYQYVKDYAAANDYYNITLNVWSCNPGAAAFYEAMGMKPQKIGMEYIIPRES